MSDVWFVSPGNIRVANDRRYVVTGNRYIQSTAVRTQPQCDAISMPTTYTDTTRQDEEGSRDARSFHKAVSKVHIY